MKTAVRAHHSLKCFFPLWVILSATEAVHDSLTPSMPMSPNPRGLSCHPWTLTFGSRGSIYIMGVSQH